MPVATKEEIDNGSYWPDRAHSMIGVKRMNNIQFCVEQCIKHKVPGDLIETGVWRGGACIFMRGILKAHGITDRKVYVADSFEGLPKVDHKYPVDVQFDYKFDQCDYLKVSLDVVKENFKSYDLLDDNVVFVKGFFEHSLKSVPFNKIAVLRLDGDMYSSTIQVLEQLYKKVSIGGYIIVDDFSIPNCAAAVNDFRKKNNITDPIVKIDWTGIYWKKTK
jgi:O-methyltransferase